MADEQEQSGQHARPPADPSQGQPPPNNADGRVDPPAEPTGRHRKKK